MLGVNIKVSILVPTLGSRSFELRRLLDSLAEQTLQNFEVIMVPQDNFDIVSDISAEYRDKINVTVINCDQKGLSVARNKGLHVCNGEIVVLSDDDCWYQKYAVERIVSEFKDTDVLLTQIFDPNKNAQYKKYSSESKEIRSRFDLLSRSSIEIAFSNRYSCRFDEEFGLGAKYVCCEEVDFLLQLYQEHARIKYIPVVTVYHEKKESASSPDQIVAKGALYSKNFNAVIALGICIRDLLIKHENNTVNFIKGYVDYKKLYKNGGN